MTNSGPQLWVNGALEMSPNISYQPLSTARFASLTLPLYMNGNSFKLVNSSPRMNGYNEGTSMSLAKLPIGFSYLNVVDSSDFPSKSGAVLKFKFGGTMYLQGWFMNGFYVRCIRDGTDTGWKKITTS